MNVINVVNIWAVYISITYMIYCAEAIVWGLKDILYLSNYDILLTYVIFVCRSAAAAGIYQRFIHC